MSHSEQYFGRRCILFAGKLKFQAKKTPYHNIFLFLEGGETEKVDDIGDMISSKLPNSQGDQKLYALEKKYNMPVSPLTAVGHLEIDNVLSDRTPMISMQRLPSMRHTFELFSDEELERT